MGRQSFRGSGGAGVVNTPVAKVDTACYGEYDLAAPPQDVLTDGERRLERALAKPLLAAILRVRRGRRAVLAKRSRHDRLRRASWNQNL